MIRNELGYKLFTRRPIRLAKPSAAAGRNEVHPLGQFPGRDVLPPQVAHRRRPVQLRHGQRPAVQPRVEGQRRIGLPSTPRNTCPNATPE